MLILEERNQLLFGKHSFWYIAQYSNHVQCKMRYVLWRQIISFWGSQIPLSFCQNTSIPKSTKQIQIELGNRGKLFRFYGCVSALHNRPLPFYTNMKCLIWNIARILHWESDRDPRWCSSSGLSHFKLCKFYLKNPSAD